MDRSDVHEADLGLWLSMLAVLALLVPGCVESDDDDDDTSSGDCWEDCPQAIQSIEVPSDVVEIPYYGDLWSNTWADDDKLYLSWGDGTGLPGCAPTYDGVTPGAWTAWIAEEEPTIPGCFWLAYPSVDPMQDMFCEIFDCSTQCFPLCPFTDAGLLALDGAVPSFDDCVIDSCIVAWYVPDPDAPPVAPDGTHQRDYKTSSVLFVDGRLYLHSHTPAGDPVEGFLAYSEDHGITWTDLRDGTPWGAESPFRVGMFLNMGQAYELNTDGYVYLYGVVAELATGPQEVYLARASRGSITDYGAWQVFAGLDGANQPRWSQDASAAVALDTVQTQVQGSAMYHEGTQRYLFLSGGEAFDGGVGALFEAVHPWGPWRRVGDLPGINISSLVAKGYGDDFVYYTAAGGTDEYHLHIRAIQMTVE